MTHNTSASILFFVLISTFIWQKVDGECSLNCNGSGFCADDSCTCFQGYFDDPATEETDCSKNVATEFRTAWLCIRVIFMALFVVLTLISFAGVAFNSRDERNASTIVTVLNVRRVVLGCVSLVGITQVAYFAIDPRFNGYIFWLEWLLWNVTFPLGLAAFVSILFHWIDLYNLSIASLRKEEMLQKINAKYKGKSITLEEVVQKVQFLKKLRIPFIVTISVFAVWAVLLIFYIVSTAGAWYHLFYAYMILNWGVLSIGFLMYGRKLVALMPQQLFKKVRKLTRRLTWLTVLCLVALSIIFIFFLVSSSSQDPRYYIARFVTQQMMILFIATSLTASFAKLSRRFPFFFRRSSTRSNSELTTEMKVDSTKNSVSSYYQ